MQTLSQLLPHTECGLHSIQLMTKNQFFILTIVIAIGAGIASQVGVHMLDQAAAKQCREHAWPKAAHQIHMDWCADNGYKTN